MKYISTLIFILAIISHSNCHSQENSKGLSLKVKDLKAVEKNGKASWTLKATLSNHARDTLFYFSTSDCEPADYLLYPLINEFDPGSVPFVSFEKCFGEQTVIAVPPGGERTVNLEISAPKALTSSFKFKLFLSVHKAKNTEERIPGELMRTKERRILVVSNKAKIKAAA
jgi:hypothetical protein